MNAGAAPMRVSARWKVACLCATSDGVPGRRAQPDQSGRRAPRHGLDQLAEAGSDILRTLCRLHLWHSYPAIAEDFTRAERLSGEEQNVAGTGQTRSTCASDSARVSRDFS